MQTAIDRPALEKLLACSRFISGRKDMQDASEAPQRPLLQYDALYWNVAFIAAYLLLDWLSFVSPLLHLNVTPWNPAPALGLLYAIRRGRGALLPLFAAIMAGEVLVRHIPGGIWVTTWLSVVLTLGYAVIASLLQRRYPDNGLFSDRKGLLPWSLIVIVGSLANSLLFISQLLLTGLLPTAGWWDAVTRFWIGDSVGIFVTFPLLWWLQDAPRRQLFASIVLHWETVAYSLLTVAVLWVAFVPGALAHFRYFYVLFLPLVWAAARQGLVGAVFCVFMLQIGMLFGGLILGSPHISLFELEMHAFLLALVGFLIGTAVDDQRRATNELRQSLRLAAAGEMAGAIAHELNQPLTALSAYGSACRQLLERESDDLRLKSVINSMIGEAERAAGVVKRLRDFFRTGATQLERIQLGDLVHAVTSSFQVKAETSRVEFSVAAIPDVMINADRLQLEVVLRNLLANAFDAVDNIAVTSKTVRLEARLAEGNHIIIDVIDSGPGLPSANIEQIFEPFNSTKSSGLGLGLAISRAITEAHGGMLTADLDGHGHFRLFLPIEARSNSSYG